jgi:hypothetical protein
MKLVRLPALLCFMVLVFSACQRDDKDARIETNDNIPVTGAQEVPATNSAANGKMTASYNTETRMLNYTVQWSGLSGPVAAMHIHASADPGFNAPVVQNIIASGSVSSGATLFNPNPAVFGASGSVSGRAFMDGIVLKEEELLGGKMYVNIHTAQFPGGEIRGQIVFK